MQAIARANRISEGKNNGLIVDYIETYTALLDALAVYGAGGEQGNDQEEDTTEIPLKLKEELLKQLEETLNAIEIFLQELHIDLKELIKATGLDKLAIIEKIVNAIYVNDETRNKFQILAREVFKKYKALQPDKVLYQYVARKNAIDFIYNYIENNTESADVTDLMRKIQNIVDSSIENAVAEPSQQGKVIDLSHLDFALLEKYFAKTQNKNMVVKSLKDRVEQRLKSMIERNPLTIDFYKRYQEIIDAYNRGKDEVIIQETFRKLIELIQSYTEEEADTKREGLTEEQKAIFDILRQGKQLNSEEKNEVKKVSIDLLHELKKEKLMVERWAEKTITIAAVYKQINDLLFNHLPYPTYETEDINYKTNLVYEHLKSQYWGKGASVYGKY